MIYKEKYLVYNPSTGTLDLTDDERDFLKTLGSRLSKDDFLKIISKQEDKKNAIERLREIFEFHGSYRESTYRIRIKNFDDWWSILEGCESEKLTSTNRGVTCKITSERLREIFESNYKGRKNQIAVLCRALEKENLIQWPEGGDSREAKHEFFARFLSPKLIGSASTFDKGYRRADNADIKKWVKIVSESHPERE